MLAIHSGKRSEQSLAPLYRVSALAQVTPRPRTRSLVVGRTGSGKSTLTGAMLEEYHRLHSDHLLYILDYKSRFQPVEPERVDPLLFPEGVRERPFGARDKVPVIGDLMEKPRHAREDETVFVVQGPGAILDFCEWQFRHSTVRRPALIYADETDDLMQGNHRAYLPFRRLVKQGREIGTGIIVLNQAPVWIDGDWIRQSDQLYVGRLTKPADREKIADEVVVPDAESYFDDPLPRFTWYYIDQENERMARFLLNERAEVAA